ncbi:hypothetical protein RJ55_02787 [Drechmeria coniospora]|nr:hypothetical protein RJ55_02787 [Drechmeria coniospora]
MVDLAPNVGVGALRRDPQLGHQSDEILAPRWPAANDGRDTVASPHGAAPPSSPLPPNAGDCLLFPHTRRRGGGGQSAAGEEKKQGESNGYAGAWASREATQGREESCIAPARSRCGSLSTLDGAVHRSKGEGWSGTSDDGSLAAREARVRRGRRSTADGASAGHDGERRLAHVRRPTSPQPQHLGPLAPRTAARHCKYEQSQHMRAITLPGWHSYMYFHAVFLCALITSTSNSVRQVVGPERPSAIAASRQPNAVVLVRVNGAMRPDAVENTGSFLCSQRRIRPRACAGYQGRTQHEAKERAAHSHPRVPLGGEYSTCARSVRKNGVHVHVY